MTWNLRELASRRCRFDWRSLDQTAGHFSQSKADPLSLYEMVARDRLRVAREITMLSELHGEGLMSPRITVAAEIIAASLVPIVEGEVDIHCPEKAKVEDLLL